MRWRAASIATRMLDNVYEVSHFPLMKQAEAARATRRLGLGLTGLADALIMLGIPYGEPTAPACRRCDACVPKRPIALRSKWRGKRDVSPCSIASAI